VDLLKISLLAWSIALRQVEELLNIYNKWLPKCNEGAVIVRDGLYDINMCGGKCGVMCGIKFGVIPLQKYIKGFLG
jgi:hypothetical protein